MGWIVSLKKSLYDEKQTELNRLNQSMVELKAGSTSLQERYNKGQLENDRLNAELEKAKADLLGSLEKNKKQDNAFWELKMEVDNKDNDIDIRHPARSNMVPNTDKVNNPINNLENIFHSRRFAN